jgi:hypothetical protein
MLGRKQEEQIALWASGWCCLECLYVSWIGIKWYLVGRSRGWLKLQDLEAVLFVCLQS